MPAAYSRSSASMTVVRCGVSFLLVVAFVAFVLRPLTDMVGATMSVVAVSAHGACGWPATCVSKGPTWLLRHSSS